MRDARGPGGGRQLRRGAARGAFTHRQRQDLLDATTAGR